MTATLLVALLALNAVLHALVVIRFGVPGNVPFLVFLIVYAALTLAVLLVWPYALWATLILAAIGLIGLTVTFNKTQRDKTLDRVIWACDLLVVLCAAYLLFIAPPPAAPPSDASSTTTPG
jgi:hypothetical protein